MARILVIDDDDALRNALQEMLTRKGYDVFTASDGEEGISLFRENPVDLIITDIVMPVKGGLRTIIDIQKEFPKTMIIAISGGAGGDADSYLETAQVLSVNHTLKKPFSNEDLLRAVKDLIG